MLNQCVLVGRIKEFDKEAKIMTIAVSRSYKNENGEYDNDLVPISIGGKLGDNVIEYCGKGDIVGVKARIESDNGQLKLIADKISFLSSKAKNDEE